MGSRVSLPTSPWRMAARSLSDLGYRNEGIGKSKSFSRSFEVNNGGYLMRLIKVDRFCIATVDYEP